MPYYDSNTSIGTSTANPGDYWTNVRRFLKYKDEQKAKGLPAMSYGEYMDNLKKSDSVNVVNPTSPSDWNARIAPRIQWDISEDESKRMSPLGQKPDPDRYKYGKYGTQSTVPEFPAESDEATFAEINRIRRANGAKEFTYDDYLNYKQGYEYNKTIGTVADGGMGLPGEAKVRPRYPEDRKGVFDTQQKARGEREEYLLLWQSLLCA